LYTAEKKGAYMIGSIPSGQQVVVETGTTTLFDDNLVVTNNTQFALQIIFDSNERQIKCRYPHGEESIDLGWEIVRVVIQNQGQAIDFKTYTGN